MFRKNSKKGDPQVEYQCTIRFLDDSEPIQLFFKVCSTHVLKHAKIMYTIHYTTTQCLYEGK